MCKFSLLVLAVLKTCIACFNTLYRTSFIILYYDQQMHSYLTTYHTTTCFDTIVSPSGNL